MSVLNMESVRKHEKKLKECPFCGCDQIQLLIQNYGWLVSCTVCSAQMRVFSSFLKTAVVQWNHRNDGTKIEPNSVHLDKQRKEFAEEEHNE